jgi:hypothetical protein
MSANPKVECRQHGWQSSILVTRYERRSKPRDVPDYYVCSQCFHAKVAADAGNSVRVGPELDV